MIELEITQTLRRLNREEFGSVVRGVMKEDSNLLGKFELSIPYREIEPKTPYWIIIWAFDISPDYRHRGYGRACYFALEKLIMEKYRPDEIYLEYGTTVNGYPSDSKGFWEKVGYSPTQGETMKKTLPA
jgi:GNAT superfamily N-acetyltransferase